MILGSQPGRRFVVTAIIPLTGWFFSVSFQLPFMKNARKNKDVAATKVAKQPVASSATPPSPDAKKKPVATIRCEDCSASIWAREHLVHGKPKQFFSVSLERAYKDSSGAWKYTRSFDPDSLGKIVSLCQQASEAIDGLTQQDVAA